MPHPSRAGLPWLGLGLVSLAAAAFGIGVRELLAVTTACVVIAAVRGVLELHDLWVMRRAADAVLRTGARVHPYSTLLTWRAGELTSRRNRRMLARSFRNIVRDLERPSLMSPVPLNRKEAREREDLLLALADVLGDLDSSIRAHGVVLVEDFLTDGANSPLFAGGYSPPGADDPTRPELGPVLEECLAALDPGCGSPSRGGTPRPFDASPDVFDSSAAVDGRISAHGGGNR